MATARVYDNKKKIGRPATGVGQMIGVRLQPAFLAALDAWIEAQDGTMTRPEAIRAILATALEL